MGSATSNELEPVIAKTTKINTKLKSLLISHLIFNLLYQIIIQKYIIINHETIYKMILNLILKQLLIKSKKQILNDSFLLYSLKLELS